MSRLTHIPLATGRSLSGRHDFKTVMEAGDCSILQPDPIACGGILETRKIAAMAEAYYMKICATDTGSPVSLMVSAHIGATVPNTLRNECNISTLKDIKKLFGLSLNLCDGALLLDDAPGLGLIPNFSKLRTVVAECL